MSVRLVDEIVTYVRVSRVPASGRDGRVFRPAVPGHAICPVLEEDLCRRRARREMSAFAGRAGEDRPPAVAAGPIDARAVLGFCNCRTVDGRGRLHGRGRAAARACLRAPSRGTAVLPQPQSAVVSHGGEAAQRLFAEIELELSTGLPSTPALSQAEMARALGVSYDTFRGDVRAGHWRPVTSDAVKHRRYRRWRHVTAAKQAERAQTHSPTVPQDSLVETSH